MTNSPCRLGATHKRRRKMRPYVDQDAFGQGAQVLQRAEQLLLPQRALTQRRRIDTVLKKNF